MTDEQWLVVALSVASTLAAGLAVGHGGVPVTIGRARLIGVIVATAIVLPTLAWALDRAFDPGIAGIGLLVASAAPGGSTGPLLAVVAGGDPATATRLFVITTLLGTVTALGVVLALGVFDPAHVARATAMVTAASLAPLLVGLALGRWRPTVARKLARPTARLGMVLLVVTVVLLCVRHGHETSASDLAISTVLVLASFAPAVLVRGRAGRLAVAQVSAVRNLGLALLVLAALDAPARATLAVLGYGLAMYLATLAVAVGARVLHPRRA